MRVSQLFEGSLESVRLSDVVNRQYIDDIIGGVYWDRRASTRRGVSMAHDDAHEMLDAYRHELPPEIQKLNDEKAIATKEFRQLVQRWAEARFSNTVEKLKAIPRRKGKIVIHRVLKVTPEWFKAVTRRGSARLGIYWTYDLGGWDEETGAHAVWGESKPGEEVRVRALVDPDHVDWRDTIRANMDWYSGDQEYELRLFPRTPIEVTSIRDHKTSRSILVRGVRFTA